jgi:hypothetical protein
MSTDNYRYWARQIFATYRNSVAYLTTVDPNGNEGIGSAFHVGDGVFITARHVVEDRLISKVGFDDDSVIYLLTDMAVKSASHCMPNITITNGPLFHSDPSVDIACFQLSITPNSFIPLGGHLDDFLSQYELVLYRTIAMGYPPIPLSDRPVLFASTGEVNALVDLYMGTKHPHFIISSMARGGYSGGPVIVAYNEDNADGGTALLGVVTQSLVTNGGAAETGYFAVLTVEPIYDCLEQHDLLPECQKPEADA